MHHNGCDNYHKFLVLDIQTFFIPARFHNITINACLVIIKDTMYG